MKQFFKGKTGSIVAAVLEIVVGVLLLINPEGFTSGIIIGAGVVMALAGAVSIIRYFMAKPEVGRMGQLLFKGLLFAMAGVLCITQHAALRSAFPILTAFYGAGMLVLSAMKVQQMADMLRAKQGKWHLPGIAAALAAVLAIFILANPAFAANAMWTVVALSIIAEAALELVGILMK